MKRTTGLAWAGLTLVALAMGCSSREPEADEPAASEDDLTQSEPYGRGAPLAYDEYTVLFTNPVCKIYEYASDQDVRRADGTRLVAKPKDAYCTQSDLAASAARDTSPEHKLIEWIRDPEVTEIFFAYLSFSNRAVGAELCAAVEERDVQVTFVLDRETDLGAANRLLSCKPKTPERAPRLELRGHDGSLGYAHDKLFFFNPSSETPRIVLSSGNLSSGTAIHHENWHFIRPHGDTHFVGAHRCLVEGLLEHGTQKTDFRTFVDGCRKALPQKEESDMRSFFVPGDGARASAWLVGGIQAAARIDLAAHRFSYNKLVSALKARLQGEAPPAVRMVFDDDMWWAGQGEVVGPNEPREVTSSVAPLVALGADARYLETNHGAHYLQHNKLAVLHFDSERADAVFAGAGNFTGTAFTDNFENFYYISVPAVVAAFEQQLAHLADELASRPEQLPTRNVLPKGTVVEGPRDDEDD